MIKYSNKFTEYKNRKEHDGSEQICYTDNFGGRNAATSKTIRF